MSITAIRDYCDADRGELCQHFRACWTASYEPLVGRDGVEEMSMEAKASGLTTMLPGGDGGCLLAVSDDLLVGSLIYRAAQETAYIWGMYVLPALQRRGIGTALLLAGIERLEGVRSIEVRVLDASPKAISFYRDLGFIIIGQEEYEMVKGKHFITHVMSKMV